MLNPQFIKDYLAKKVNGDFRVSSNNAELILPSLFTDHDYKKHMSINLDTGLWQCFKTGKRGNFIKLYSLLEDITYKAAECKLLFEGIESGMWSLWEEKQKKSIDEPVLRTSLDTSSFLPVNIDSYDTNNQLVLRAWKFLMDRGLLNTDEYVEDPFYVAPTGKYRGRLIIPFKDYEGNIFFFQGRSLMNGVSPKYLNPNSENGVKSSNILYPFDFEADHLCICEGPTDAISLKLNGLNATCTIGSTISNVQMQALNEFEGELILTYDSDAAGQRGIAKFDHLRKKYMLPTFSICTAPPQYKDWNEAHIGKEDLLAWVMKNKYEYTDENKLLSLL